LLKGAGLVEAAGSWISEALSLLQQAFAIAVFPNCVINPNEESGKIPRFRLESMGAGVPA